MSRKMHVESLKNRARYDDSPDWHEVTRKQSRYVLEDQGEPVRNLAGHMEVFVILLVACAWVAMLFLWIYGK